MSAMSQDLNSPHMQADDVPPPPYSETDIYSNSGRPRSPNTTTTTSPDTASRVSSSTGGDVVYTPPLTPQTSLNTHAQDSRQQPLPTTQPGATLYFESRPPPAAAAAAAATGLQRDVVVYSVKVQGTSSPDDLPYQNRWAARDVTSQDWATFVNFLLPDHTTRGNAAVIERKLRAEEASGDASPVSGCRVQAEAQLEKVRENQPSTTRTKREIEATIQQWNDGFFGPRGMKLKLELDQETGALARRGPGCDGDTLVLDRNGIQSNRLTPCSNGISRARRGCSSGRRDGPEDGNAAGPSRQAGRPEQSTSRDDFRRDMHHGRHGRRGRRGRRSADGGRGRRSRRDEKHYSHSRSSSESSVSSVASSSSESSIGSLPGSGDIKDHRLPLYTERLRDWTSNPDQMRTKSDVRALRADVQSTRWMPEDARLGQSVDRTALEAQIRGLHAQWKSIKKAQRQTRRRERRAERREQRHRRREMRRACRDYSTQGLLGPFGMMPAPFVPAVPPVPSATSGRGGRGASSFGAVRAPGAWPEDDGHEAGVAAPPPGTASTSTAKYEAAEQIEAEVGKMISRAADLGGGVERRALEKAIEALTDNLDTLRMEADEAYARELAASEAGY